MQIETLLRVWIIAIVGSLSAGASYGSIVVSTNASYADNCDSVFFEDPNSAFSDFGFVQSVSSTTPGLPAQGHASGTSGMGYFAARAAVSGVLDCEALVSSFSGMSFSDTVVLREPGIIGPRTIQPRVQFSGNGDASGVGQGCTECGAYVASFVLQLTVADHTATIAGDWDARRAALGGPLYVGAPITGIFEFPPVTIELGVPFVIQANLQLTASGAVSGTTLNGEASADFLHTFRWLGLDGLSEVAFVEQGQIDWLQAAPVPTPSSFLTLAVFGVVSGRRRGA